MAIGRSETSFSFSIQGVTDGVVSRREFIAGAAMVSLFPALSQAKETAGAAFSVEESPAAFRFRFVREGKAPLDLIVSKSYWGDIPGSKVPPKFFIERSDKRPVDPQSATVVLRVSGASFAGRKDVAADLVFDLRGDDCRVRLKLSNWPRRNTVTSFDWIDFARFIVNRRSTGTPYRHPKGALTHIR
ncbi:hypothetical protein ACVWXN_008027 [Bradyrhizobium sp. i1.4.4]